MTTLVVQMIEVGEQTGQLDTMLQKVGQFYDGEVDSTVGNLTSMLEPMLTVGHGSRCRGHGGQHVPADVRLHQARTPELSTKAAMEASTSRPVGGLRGPVAFAKAVRATVEPAPLASGGFRRSRGTGMSYSFLLGARRTPPALLDHSRRFVGYLPSAHFIGWGYLGGVYSAGAGLVTFPGILLLLAPVAMLTGALGLTESFPRFVLHPTAWLLLGPFEILLSSVALFAMDALAERWAWAGADGRLLCVVRRRGFVERLGALGTSRGRRCGGSGASTPFVFALDGRWTGAGWLFGARNGHTAAGGADAPRPSCDVWQAAGHRFLARSFLPFVALMATPLIAQFHPTLHAILDQPNYPRIDHATPWTVLAPKLGGGGKNVAVAAGPGRIVAVLLACGLGLWARRRVDRPDALVWAAALAMALRCFTESVMVSFYIWPALAIGLLVAAHAGRWQLAFAGVVAVLTTVLSSWRLGELPWWASVTTGIVLVLAAGGVDQVSRHGSKMPMTPGDHPSVSKLETRSAQLMGASAVIGHGRNGKTTMAQVVGLDIGTSAVRAASWS